MADVEKIFLYQSYLERYLERTGEDVKILHIFKKLRKMPISLEDLQNTGIGKNVNSYRRHEGKVGEKAKELVLKWKQLMPPAVQRVSPSQALHSETVYGGGKSSSSPDNSRRAPYMNSSANLESRPNAQEEYMNCSSDTASDIHQQEKEAHQMVNQEDPKPKVHHRQTQSRKVEETSFHSDKATRNKQLSSPEIETGSNRNKKHGHDRNEGHGSAKREECRSSRDSQHGSRKDGQRGSSKGKQHGSKKDSQHTFSKGSQRSSSKDNQHGSSKGSQRASSKDGQRGSSRDNQHDSSRDSQQGSSKDTQRGCSKGSQHGPSKDSEHGSSKGSRHGSGKDSQYGSSKDSEYGSGKGSQRGSSRDSSHGSSKDKWHGSSKDSQCGSTKGSRCGISTDEAGCGGKQRDSPGKDGECSSHKEKESDSSRDKTDSRRGKEADSGKYEKQSSHILKAKGRVECKSGSKMVDQDDALHTQRHQAESGTKGEFKSGEGGLIVSSGQTSAGPEQTSKATADASDPRNSRSVLDSSSSESEFDHGGLSFEEMLNYGASTTMQKTQKKVMAAKSVKRVSGKMERLSENEVPRDKEKVKEKESFMDKDSSKATEQFRSKERAEDEHRSKDRKRTEDKQRSRNKEGSGDKRRSKDKGRSEDRQRSKEKRSEDRQRSKDNERSEDRQRSKEKERTEDRKRSKDKERTEDRKRSKGKERSEDRQRSEDKERSKQRDKCKPHHPNVSSKDGLSSSKHEHEVKPCEDRKHKSVEPLEVPKPSKQLKLADADILSDLPETLPDYKPLPRFLQENPGGLTTAVPSLIDACLRVLMDNIDALDYVGGVPCFLLMPVLEKCTASQLYSLEDSNPKFIEETEKLWEKHCAKDFRGARRGEMETHRELYLRMFDEREQKLKKLTQNISATVNKASKEARAVKLAYVDTVAKAPRSVRRQQLKHGTAGPVGKLDPLAKLSSHGGAENSPRAPFPRHRSMEVAPSRKKEVKVQAPMMKKTMQLMKKMRR